MSNITIPTGSSPALCCYFASGLTVLQYRWTGEIANAEMTRLRADLDVQSRAFASAFDTELSENCDDLLPYRSDPDKTFGEEWFVTRFNAWKSVGSRPMFSRIAMVSPVRGELQLAILDTNSQQFVRTNWPESWADLDENLTEKLSGNSPPFMDPQGALMEFPVFDGGPPRGGRIDPNHVHWLILELDMAYARDVWLPELFTRYLDPDRRGRNEVQVETGGFTSEVLYSSQTNGPRPGAFPVIARL